MDVAVDRIEGEAQVALTSAAAKVGRLVEALATTPVAPRKVGGLPVRDTKRLAKAMDVDEREAVFWIDLAYHARLIRATQVDGATLVCPTKDADLWLAAPLSARLALILQTWLHLDDIVTWQPFEETPIAGIARADRHATPVRQATLGALTTLPVGQGCLLATAPLAAREPVPVDRRRALASLFGVASWFAPWSTLRYKEAERRVWHTVYEAGLLGVVALGALTDVGRALLSAERDDTDAVLIKALMEALPVERTTARFQADMTVIVGGTPAPQLAGLLNSVAERESEGQAVVYRITRASVRRALDGGNDPTVLLTQLSAVAEGDVLPQPVTYLVTEIARIHGQVRVVDAACCLRIDDESLAAEILRSRALEALGLHQLAPNVLVSRQPSAQTLAALRAAGYAPTHQSGDGSTIVDIVRGPRAPAARPRGRTPDALALAKRLLDSARPVTT